MQLEGTLKKYCLQRSAIVDQKDIASAAFDKYAYDKSTIKLTLQPDAARRLKDATRKNIGLEVGVVLSGRLVSVAMIAAETGQVWVAGLPQGTARSVVEAFQGQQHDR